SAIIFSAATSRSMVLDPSTAISFNFCRICQTSNPLRRIFSNSAAVLRTIMRLHRLANLPKHPVRRLVVRVHTYDSAPGITVPLEHRVSLPLVGVQPLPDDRLAVII